MIKVLMMECPDGHLTGMTAYDSTAAHLFFGEGAVSQPCGICGADGLANVEPIDTPWLTMDEARKGFAKFREYLTRKIAGDNGQ